MLADEKLLRNELAIAYRIAAHFKWDDLIYGHLSCRIPSEPDCYLINAFGLMFDEVTPHNLLKVDLLGNILSNNPYNYNPAGENVHAAIYENRKDVGGIIHIHTNEGMAVSTLIDGILPLTQHACHLMGRIATHTYEGIAVEKDERVRLCHDIADKDILILNNHGILTVGKDIGQVFCTMYMLQKTIQSQILALSLNRPLHYINEDVSKKVMAQAIDFGSHKNYKMEWDALVRMIRRKEKIDW